MLDHHHRVIGRTTGWHRPCAVCRYEAAVGSSPFCADCGAPQRHEPRFTNDRSAPVTLADLPPDTDLRAWYEVLPHMECLTDATERTIVWDNATGQAAYVIRHVRDDHGDVRSTEYLTLNDNGSIRYPDAQTWHLGQEWTGAGRFVELRQPRPEAYEHRLWFGLSIDSPETCAEVTADQWSRFVAAQVAPRFPGGFTVHDAHGHWAALDEPTKVLSVVGPAGLQRDLQPVAAAYKRAFSQESVLYTRAPVALESL